MGYYKRIHKHRSTHKSEMAISKDGHTMFERSIVADLNRGYFLEEENKKLKQALQQIKDHMETICPSGKEMSAVWLIANRALKGV